MTYTYLLVSDSSFNWVRGRVRVRVRVRGQCITIIDTFILHITTNNAYYNDI
jgi:hypothetical protein